MARDREGCGDVWTLNPTHIMVEEDTRAMAAQAGQASVDPVQASDGPHASEVSATVSQDGGDGDDELDEDDSGEDEDDDEQEVEEEEEEPRLKYQRLGGSVPGIVSSSGASCLTVAERIIALGSSDGTVHLLDYQGNQVGACDAVAGVQTPRV